jgi:hypothetical protein
MSRLGEVAVRRRKHSQCTATPSTPSARKDTGTISTGLMPSEVVAIQVRYAPTIKNSPWAMFRIRINPYCRFSPRATSA